MIIIVFITCTHKPIPLHSLGTHATLVPVFQRLAGNVGEAGTAPTVVLLLVLVPDTEDTVAHHVIRAGPALELLVSLLHLGALHPGMAGIGVAGVGFPAVDAVPHQRVGTGSAHVAGAPAEPKVHTADTLVAGLGRARVGRGGALDAVAHKTRWAVAALGLVLVVVAAHAP